MDIVTPGNSHHRMAVAAPEAGKHIICEKPLANTLDEAREMLDAAREVEARAGTVNMICFNCPAARTAI